MQKKFWQYGLSLAMWLLMLTAWAHAAGCLAPPSGQVGWWPGDGNAADLVGKRDGTLQGGLSFSDGLSGQSFDLTTTNGTKFVQVADNAALRPTRFTVEAWAYPTALNGWSAVVTKGSSGGDSRLNFYSDTYWIGFQDGKPDFETVHTGNLDDTLFGSGDAALNQWHHLVGTFDGVTKNLYMDGVLVASRTINRPVVYDSGNVPLIIGQDWENGATNTDVYDGLIDEVSLYSRALSAAEVLALFEAGSAGKCKPSHAPAPTLHSWWPGDGNAQDYVGGVHGTLAGGTLYAPGKVGTAFSLDGSDDRVTMGSSAYKSIYHKLSISAWVYPRSQGNVSGYGKVVLSNTENHGFAMRVADGFLQADLPLTGGQPRLSTFNAQALPLNAWSHIVLSWDGTNVRGYLNGTLLGTFAATGATQNTANAGADLLIGNEPDGFGGIEGGYGWDGMLDEVQLYERDLKQGEVNSIFNAGAAGDSKFVVTNTRDSGFGSLRQAVLNSNAGDGTDVVTFKIPTTDSGYNAGTGLYTIPLTSGEITITDSVSIAGPGSNVVAVNGSKSERIFYIDNNQVVNIADLTMANGTAPSVGGGALVNNHSMLTLRRCAFNNNSGDDGGAIYAAANTTADSLIIIDCTFSGNTATFNGGGVYNDGFGGNAHMTVTGSTFVNNTTGGYGGGIYNTGATGTATLTVTNSTFQGNDANNAGGGIFNDGSGGLVTAAVRHCTFNLNNANFGGSAIWSGGPATSQVFISHNIFRVDVRGITLADDSNGSLISQGYNLSSDGSGDDPLTVPNETYLTAPSDRIRTDPLLDPAGLADNGGPTQTVALLNGSPAINTGDPAFAGSPTTDQRGAGFSRVQGGRLDIGALESLGLSINNVSLAEGDSGTTAFNFTVTLAAPSNQTVTVQYASGPTNNNIATAGVDYIAVPLTTLTFTPGQTSKTISVQVNGDVTNEALERFAVNLSNPTNTIILDGEGIGTILNDDAVPSLNINDVTLAEGNSGTTAFTFTVSLSAVSGQTVKVNYATTVPTTSPATAGSDYTALSLTPLTFAPGETSKTVTVQVNGDTQVEGNEKFSVRLSNPVNTSLGKMEGFGTITNDDAAPLLFEQDAPSE